MGFPKRALIIFLKIPQLGRVKTRLASTVGNARALEIYTQLLKKTLELAKTLTDCQRYLFFDPEVAREWVPDNFIGLPQEGKNLGERMAKAIDSVLLLHDQVIIIGTDCPYITTDLIRKSFTILNGTDLVLGPAKDGGYYLLGLSKMHLPIFEDIAWSTAEVLKQTLDTATELGLSFELLSELSDIDYEEDWIRYLKTLTA